MRIVRSGASDMLVPNNITELPFLQHTTVDRTAALASIYRRQPEIDRQIQTEFSRFGTRCICK